ncbi:MAG TPA: fumarylacetoacetate hydrolase family protein [Nakamurella sp.]|jgi:2-dehydro-3-deoxy-D-arabinonate dehydratase
MHLVRFRTVADATPRVGVRTDDGLAPLPVGSAAELWRLPIDELRSLTESVTPQPIPPDVAWLPPVDGRTEVWAAGVTYLRSRDARVQESRQQSVYEQVYDAGRPELFYKAAAWRVVTDGEPVAIRTDSTDDVPEPELAVVFGAHGGILGYLVSNDMSSRSIEGENPLYLPQAKIYAGSCALSSGVRPAWEVDASDLAVTMVIRRGDVTAFEGATRTSHMRRTLPELAEYLFRAEHFPDGVVLSTGTGVVPQLGAGVAVGDEVTIEIEAVGRLRNEVVSRPEVFVGLADGVRPPS